MAYNPSSFNYTPMQPGQFGAASSGTFQPSAQFMDFAKWLSQQGMDMFNLARADKNTQLQVANAFQQQQADRADTQQQFQNTQQQQMYGDARMRQAMQDMDASAARSQAFVAANPNWGVINPGLSVSGLPSNASWPGPGGVGNLTVRAVKKV